LFDVFDGHFCLFGFQISLLKNPRAVLQRMQGGNLTTLDGFPQGQHADAQLFGGLCKAKPAFLVPSLDIVFGNAAFGAERTDSLAAPAIAAAGEDAVAIQNIGDGGIVTDSSQLFDGLRGSRIHMVKGLPALATTNVEFRMDAAFPVDDGLDPTGRRIDINEHFFDQRSGQAFLQSDIHMR
jgi:hypothetical protein